MSEMVNRERLIEVRAWVEKEIDQIERRRAEAPLMNQWQSDTQRLMVKELPEKADDPAAATRQAALKLEEIYRNSEGRQAKAEETRRQKLAQARAHTAALRDWLEALS